MTARAVLDAIDTAAVRPSARVKRVAALLDCDESQVRRLVYDGALEAHRVGKRGVRIYLDSVRAYQDHGAAPARRPAQPGRRQRSAASTAALKAAMADLRRDGLL